MSGIYVLRDRTPVRVEGLDQYEGTDRVAFTEVSPEIAVSTVFLGVDHRHFGEGPPLQPGPCLLSSMAEHRFRKTAMWVRFLQEAPSTLGATG